MKCYHRFLPCTGECAKCSWWPTYCGSLPSFGSRQTYPSRSVGLSRLKEIWGAQLTVEQALSETRNHWRIEKEVWPARFYALKAISYLASFQSRPEYIFGWSDLL